MNVISVQSFITPITSKKSRVNLFNILLTLGTAYWLYNCFRVVTEGLSLFGIDSYGATWGILIANTVHIIGISHVGIAISAAVRVLNLERYRNVARVAEVVTLIALVMAVINLLLHVGRPERFIVNVILYGKWYSPMVWSMTVFSLYFLASSVYLFLSMRRDLWAMTAITSRFKGLYRFLSLGYQDSEENRARHNRTLYWLAICLIPIMISVHSVYGLLFGMISAKAGWYNPLQAPYFVLGAIVSGFSAIIAIAAFMRRAYDWKEFLSDRLFKVFGSFLAFVIFLYLYFTLSEHLTAQYLPKTADKIVSDSLLTGQYSSLFWLTIVVGLIVPFAFLFVQSVRKNAFSLSLTAGAAIFVNVALWLKRYLLVVPSQFAPNLIAARPEPGYVPTHTEWAIVIGSYVAAALVFVALLRIFPMFELPVPTEVSNGEKILSRFGTRKTAMLLSLLGGVLMIAWGLLTRESDFGPVKWLIGIIFLVAIPLENCLIQNTRTEEAEDTKAQPRLS